ncbi:hypothetical protein BT69DRAFT_1334777 [Atractiella rhizophila]|nr:hypothetical protein BT69DRAFT_1334777 [Atractiella rhizophila]
MARAEGFGEFKVRKESDPFEDAVEEGTETVRTVETDSITGRQTRGQIIIYSTMILSTQQRTRPEFKSRILSITPRITTFKRRYTHASQQERGHDTTFVPAPENKVSNRAREVLNLSPNESLFMVSVESAGTKTRHFYVSTPFNYRHNAPIGRGTRCFRAFDPAGANEEEQRVFLKDTWRNTGYTQAEGEVYESLKKKGVPHVLKLVAHGDVRGRPKLLLGLGGNHSATIAHEKAFDASNDAPSILHRDISEGNILFDDKGQGFLGDWELAKVGGDSSDANERTGTEEFMSLRLLESMVHDSPVRHEVQDDMESFVYVLLWIAASYAASDMAPDQRGHSSQTLIECRSTNSQHPSMQEGL